MSQTYTRPCRLEFTQHISISSLIIVKNNVITDSENSVMHVTTSMYIHLTFYLVCTPFICFVLPFCSDELSQPTTLEASCNAFRSNAPKTGETPNSNLHRTNTVSTELARLLSGEAPVAITQSLYNYFLNTAVTLISYPPLGIQKLSMPPLDAIRCTHHSVSTILDTECFAC